MDIIKTIRAEIERLKEVLSDPLMTINGPDYIAGGRKIANTLLSFLDTLQEPEVDLEKEIRSERKKLLDIFGPMNGEQSLAIEKFARHFYELDKNAK